MSASRKGQSWSRLTNSWRLFAGPAITPGGSPEHYAVAHYGASPTKLTETAQSPIRLNPTHSYPVFRVRIDGLKPRTTYYYKIDSMGTNGKVEGVKSPVKQFTTS